MSAIHPSSRSKSVAKKYHLNHDMHERMKAIQNFVANDGVYTGKLIKSIYI